MSTSLESLSYPKEDIVGMDLTPTSSSDYGISDSTVGLGVNSVGPTEAAASMVSLENADRSNHTRISNNQNGQAHSVVNEYDIGDIVWGKVKSYPWWPGQIYDESLVSVDVSKSKREGYVFVTFFGDGSYEWFDPAELLPFEPNFSEKSQQTSMSSFLNAVDEALNELSRRKILGLSCPCRNELNFNVDGYLAVDVGEYEPRLYSSSQINKARGDLFRPEETLSFIQKLALAPMNGQRLTIEFIKNKTAILACRKARFPVAVDPSKDAHYQPLSHHQAAPSVSGMKKSCERRKVDLPILLHDLCTFAIDPFHGSCPSLVQQAFMKYRSLVYQKSVFLSELSEARRPTKLLATDDDMPTSSRPTNAGRKYVPILLSDLCTLAIDPFHGSCPSLVQKAFLKYRSLVYQKSVFLSELEARRPTATADDMSSTMKPSSRPTTNAGRKHGPSNRPEHIIKKKRKKIDGSKDYAEESESDSSLQASNYIVEDSSLPINTMPTSAAEQQVPGTSNNIPTTSNEPQNMPEDMDIVGEAMRLRKRAFHIMDNLKRQLTRYEPFIL